MCVKRFFLICALFCLLAVSLPAEQWYRVSETELTRLEMISQTWEMDKQSWLSQASELKGKVQTLQAESKTLNAQLEVERTKTQSLRKSFELSEIDRLKQVSEHETTIAGLKADKAKIVIDGFKVRNQRNVLIFLSSMVFFCLVLLILNKMDIIDKIC